MKAVILAGGLGSRLAEETHLKPKPMLEIGGNPLLWHIMKIYSHHNVHDFIICCGYKGYVIKEYFSNYFLHQSDVTFDLANNQVQVHHAKTEPWRVTLLDTGDGTMTGGRLKRIAAYLQDETAFCMTYGDGVGNIDVTALLAFHRQQRLLATVTATLPPSRFGALDIDGSRVRGFKEKPQAENAMINGGFFVLSPKVLDLITDDSTVWEHEPLEQLAKTGELAVFKHHGFWQPMDTLRDKNLLDELWKNGNAPWKVWV